MQYIDLIISSSTVVLSSTLVVDTLMRPKQIFDNWSRQRSVKRIIKQFKQSKGNWIIISGTEKSGKSAILQAKEWHQIKSTFIGKQAVHIWQFKDNPLWALEISFSDMGGISDQWWQSLKKLNAKRVYYCLTTDDCKRFKARHSSKIDTHIVISHADKIQGFSPFMSDMADQNSTFPIGQMQNKSFTTNYLKEAFETLYAQLQTYGNQLLNRVSNPEVKKIINDFPQHCQNLQLGLAKVITAMPVKQIYCYGQIWQNGMPKMVFSPTLASGLHVVKRKNYTWRKLTLISIILLMTAQIVLFKSHLQDTWDKQSVDKLTKAQSHMDDLEQKQPVLKFVSKLLTPKFSLSHQQVDEAQQLANNYEEALDQMSPIIAALEIRGFMKRTDENPTLQHLLQNLLKDKNITLQDIWNKASDEEQYNASLHYIHGVKNIDSPLPNTITDTHIKTACLALSNRMSQDECVKTSSQWLQPDFKKVTNFKDLVNQLEKQTFDAKVKPIIKDLTLWLSQIANNPKKAYVSFEFLIKHSQKPDASHPLNKLRTLEKTYPELQNIQLVTWQLLLDEAGIYMNGIWKKTIYPYYAKQFAKSYPIIKDSPKDASLNAFNQFYGVGGLINIYYNNYIMPFVDAHVQTFKTVYPGTIFPVKESNLNYFKSVAAVQTLLYQGDTSPHLEINLTPTYEKETWSIKSNEMAMKMDQPVIIGWPAGISQEAFSIFEGKKKVVEFKGIWGFWRWFESGDYSNETLSFPNHAFKIFGQTESDLNWLVILRSQQPNPSIL